MNPGGQYFKWCSWAHTAGKQTTLRFFVFFVCFFVLKVIGGKLRHLIDAVLVASISQEFFPNILQKATYCLLCTLPASKKKITNEIVLELLSSQLIQSITN